MFADELADDRTRAARFDMDNGAVPDSSLIFHKYSQALHSVVVDVKGGTIELHFEITDSDAKRQFPKDGKSIFILDEIIGRTIKMHQERIYCGRFMRPHINLDTISVKISVFGATQAEAVYDKELATIAYRLEDRGYPSDNLSVLELCPELKHWHGSPLSGGALADYLEKRVR
jgi:hypothetical protein